MGEVVNLRKARKLERQEAERTAAANRVLHGRSKAERTLDAQRKAKSNHDLDPTGSNGRRSMKSPVVKRSIVIAGHKTSVSLEDAFWKGLKDIAGGRDTTLSDLVASIDSERRHGNLSSAIRLFVLDDYRALASDDAGVRNGPREMAARLVPQS